MTTLTADRQEAVHGDEGAILAEKGMVAAVEHANRESLAWSDRAVSFIHIYAILHEELTCELVRLWSEPLGMPKPPDGRAWGWCMRRARKNGYVEATERTMSASDPKVHSNRCRIWRSLIHVPGSAGR